jgi:hypothetical protein
MLLNKKEANSKCRHSSLCLDVCNNSGWREGDTHRGEKLREEAIAEAEFLDEIQTKVLELSFVLFTATTIALLGDLYFFKLTQPYTVSTEPIFVNVQGAQKSIPRNRFLGSLNVYKFVLCLVSVDCKEKEENLIENHTFFLMVKEIHTEISILRTLRIMPRNLNEIVH